MLSFRVDDRDAGELGEWADRLGVDRSALLREALRRYLARLNSEVDTERWESLPPSAAERSLEEIADWGPAEDWSDWVDAAR
jgi:predicted transcriptional regulator